MVSTVERYAAGLLGFGLVAVSATAGITTALLAGLAAFAAYGLAAFGQRRRLDHFTEAFMVDSADRPGGNRRARRQPRNGSRRAA